MRLFNLRKDKERWQGMKKYKVWRMGGVKDDIKEEMLIFCFSEKIAKMCVNAGIDAGIRLAAFDEQDNKIYPLL
jgi:hypothetical protein